jgi:heme/copper-type cytochrome/quinol oxidase subunit 2
MRQESGSQRRSGASAGAQQGFGMFVLRLWMWAVPSLMLAGAFVFGAIAASDERWGLFVVMIVMGLLAIGLLVFHWWVLYRFGSRAR